MASRLEQEWGKLGYRFPGQENWKIPYAAISDAVRVTGNKKYEEGPAEVWYFKDSNRRNMMMGFEWLAFHEELPDPTNLRATHVHIGSVNSRNPEEVYSMMQGEVWSPNGEARTLVMRSGTGHTSMSMGDIVKIGSDVFLVDMAGFKNLTPYWKAVMQGK